MADIDFILSIRDEKIAMALELFLDWGWVILLGVGIFWILTARGSAEDQTNVHWGMVTAVGILSFIAGTLITVHAVGAAPNVLAGWGGDPLAQNCSANIDTSRLVGRKDKNRVILLCGVSDPTRDPMEDDRIAVSQPFTISGQITSIVAPYGAMAAAIKQGLENSKQVGTAQNENLGFILWHAVALIPRDVNVSEIKTAADVEKRGGKIVTEPKVGAFGIAQAIPSGVRKTN